LRSLIKKLTQIIPKILRFKIYFVSRWMIQNWICRVGGGRLTAKISVGFYCFLCLWFITDFGMKICFF